MVVGVKRGEIYKERESDKDKEKDKDDIAFSPDARPERIKHTFLLGVPSVVMLSPSSNTFHRPAFMSV